MSRGAAPPDGAAPREKSAIDTSALLLILLFAAGIGITLLLMRATLRWTAVHGARNAASRFQAVEQIVNDGLPPDAWLEPHRQRMERLRGAGAPPGAIAREGQRAQQRCLRELDRLARFLKEGSFYDSPDTKAGVLEALRERRSAWTAADWRALTRWNA